MEREPADGRRRGEKRVARDGDIDFKKGDEGEKGSRGEKREGLILESANGMAPFFFLPEDTLQINVAIGDPF